MSYFYSTTRSKLFYQTIITAFIGIILCTVILPLLGRIKFKPVYPINLQNNDYSINLQLENSGILNVTEIIKSDLINDNKQEFTKIFNNSDDRNIKIRLKEATLNGNPISYSLIKLDNSYLLKIKLTNQNLSNNNQNLLNNIPLRGINYFSTLPFSQPKLVLKYQLIGSVAKLHDKQLLKFSLINSNKNIAIKNIILNFALPENISSNYTKAEIFDNNSLIDAHISYNQNLIQGQLKPDLINPNYMFLCYLPKNSINLNQYDFINFYWLWDYIQPGFLIPAITLLIFSIQLLLLSPNKKTTVKNTECDLSFLNNLSPGEIGIIYDEKFDPRDLSAIIIDLAIRGFINIQEIQSENLFLMSDKDLVFNKLKNFTSQDNLKDFEFQILFNMFSVDKKNIKFSTLIDSFGNTSINSITDLVYFNLKKQGYITLNPTNIRRVYYILALAYILWAGFYAFSLISFTYGIYYETVVINLLPSIIGLSLSSIFIYTFANHIPIRSINGLKLYEQIKYLKDFIINASQNDIDTLYIENPYMFYKILCLSIALDLEPIWAAKIKTIIKSSPVWYQSVNDNNNTFISEIGNTIRLLDYGNKRLFMFANQKRVNLDNDCNINNRASPNDLILPPP